MYKVIDNFLTKSYHEEIQERLTGDGFPWFYNANVSGHWPQEHISHDVNNPTGTPLFKDYAFSHHIWKEVTTEMFENADIGGLADTAWATFLKPFLLQVMDTVGCDMILRCRGDMTTWSPEEFIHPAHTDYPFPNASSIYYLHDTDGDTILYGKDSFDHDIKIDQHQDGTLSQTIGGKTTTLEIKERISPKANRLLLFDGNLLHTGSSPTKHKTRILINSNFHKRRITE